MMGREQIAPGSRAIGEWDAIVNRASLIADVGERIRYLSGFFLGTAYAESTLIGDRETPETLVIDLGHVDCMTFLEYVEAMRLSSSFSEFIRNLRRVRYRSGIVDYSSRNHFFSDWKERNAELVEDITERIGGERTVCAVKRMNVKEDGTPFLPGIPSVSREILHIPSASIDSDILEKMENGCYVGIYADTEGLDVTHAGIVLRHDGKLSLRHASSTPARRRVIDEDFSRYVAGTPGVVVYRPRG